MRAGKLDRTIDIVRVTDVDDGYGGLTPGVRTVVATMRAQIVEASTEEFMRAFGASTERAVIFRTRWTDDITLGDIVVHDGRDHNIIELKEIGRHRGREIRCRAVGA